MSSPRFHLQNRQNIKEMQIVNNFIEIAFIACDKHTLVFGFIGSFGIETLQQYTNILVQLIPIAIDYIQNGIVLCLPLFQLLYA